MIQLENQESPKKKLPLIREVQKDVWLQDSFPVR